MTPYERALALLTNDLLLIQLDIERTLTGVVRPVDIVLCLDDDGEHVKWTVWLADVFTLPHPNAVCGHVIVDVDANTFATTTELLNQCLETLAERAGGCGSQT